MVLEESDPVKADLGGRTVCHWALLGVAGAVPDSQLAKWRSWLAEGRVKEVAGLVAQPFDGPDLDDLELSSPQEHGFAASLEVMAAAATGAAVNPSMLVAASRPGDAHDEAVVGAVSEDPAVRAVWRCWRFPADDPTPSAAVRVFVVEAGQDADLPALTGKIQEALVAAGEEHPRVEVYPVHAAVPEYLQAARMGGGLIWAHTPDPGIRVAAVFDDVDPDGEPRMSGDRPTVAGPEAERLLGYLDAGAELVVDEAVADDVVDPLRGAVPVGLRTDGFWIWSNASTYYLREHRFALDADFTRHIRERDYVMPEVDGAARYRAIVALYVFGEEEPDVSA